MTEFDYAAGLDAYLDEMRARWTTAGATRLEHHFECLRDWSRMHSLEEVKRWFLARRSGVTMAVDEIPLVEMRDWQIDSTTGTISHVSGDFFTVHGIRVSRSVGREVGAGGWDQPMVTQVGFDGGLLGLLRQRIEGVPHYLIEAKEEPGNPGIVQLSPTLQATFSNLRRSHGGRRPRFAEIFEDPEGAGATVLYSRWLSEDGGRLFNKRNRGVLVEVPAGFVETVPDGFIWMSMYQIKACLLEDAWVNPHVRGIIAHL